VCSFTRSLGRALCALSVLVSATQAQERTAWTTSRLQGSPDPPLPFTTERVLAAIKWDKPLYALTDADGDRKHLLVMEEGNDSDRPMRLFRVNYRSESPAKDLFFELPKFLVYGLTLDPDYLSNGFLYLFQKGHLPAFRDRGVRISRYRVMDHKIDPASELPIIEWRTNGHDGGDLAFGQDGMLYITTGDGSTDSDQWVSGQTLDDLLGSVLRIDVRQATTERPYTVPSDNPFLDHPGARPEIWAYGLRNPWRMTADRKSGQIWVGNNGQDLWETAHLLGRGENYGWSVFEGNHPFYPNRQLGPTPHVPPTIEHPHSEFRSLTGGVIYRGEKWPELDGAYVYGDYATGRIWAARHDDKKMLWHRELADTSIQIAGFTLAPGGDLIVIDHGGNALHRLVKSPPPPPNAPLFPELLSKTGLFKSVTEQSPEAGVVAYQVNSEGWNDGATSQRWMAVPESKKAVYKNDQPWDFPNGTALAQTLSLPAGEGGPARKVETRVLLRQQNEWQGYSYRWNKDGGDAVLVPSSGADAEIEESGQKYSWRFPSRAQCALCHNRAALYVLGITGRQLNRLHEFEGDQVNQLALLQRSGFFSNQVPETLPEPLANPREVTEPLEARAHSYLHTNCSICHVASGGGNAQFDVHITIPRDKKKVIEARPQHATFGLPDAMIVAPGRPDASVLLHRVSGRGKGSGEMPPLGSNHVDKEAVEMLRDWIAGLNPSRPIVKEWTMADFSAELATFDQHQRHYLGGREAFAATGCIQCHRFGEDGGSVGPGLNGIGKRATTRDLLASILEPSRHIAEGFAIPGTDPAISTMPPGMVNVLGKEQVLDLLYYLKRDSRPRVAAIVTEYRHNSHADIIVSRLLQTDTLDGKGEDSPLELVSLYTDQVPESDTSRLLSTSHRFPIYPTIAEALTLGTGELAVDGVLLIAEHGDYPKSDTGNTQYPKRRFWEECLKVFDTSKRTVPVFIDKHLSDNWADAKFLYDSAKERGIPLMAGSSLPTTWRRPAADVRHSAKLKEIVALSYHTTDAYGFHTLEIIQALAEQRQGGETGITAVHALADGEVWRAFDEQRFNRSLFEAAWSRLTNPRDLKDLRRLVARPRLFSIEYKSGLRAHMLELNGAVNEWAAAWNYQDSDQVESSLFWTQEGRPGMHFTWLLHGIERMILTGQPSWNAERTLYTSGTLDAFLLSLKSGKRLETPYLNIPYQPTWRWLEPPPPPPTRPWSGQ